MNKLIFNIFVYFYNYILKEFLVRIMEIGEKICLFLGYKCYSLKCIGFYSNYFRN